MPRASSSRSSTRSRWLRRHVRRLSAIERIAALVVGVAGVCGVVAGVVRSITSEDPWRTRADAACLSHFDALGDVLDDIDARWRLQVRKYQALERISVPPSDELEWRRVRNASADLADLLGKAAHSSDGPASVMAYYARAIDDDARQIAEASGRLALHVCGEPVVVERESFNPYG